MGRISLDQAELKGINCAHQKSGLMASCRLPSQGELFRTSVSEPLARPTHRTKEYAAFSHFRDSHQRHGGRGRRWRRRRRRTDFRHRGASCVVSRESRVVSRERVYGSLADSESDPHQALNIVLSGITGGLVIAITNPLDALKNRWQTLAPSQVANHRSLPRFLVHTVQTEGYHALALSGLAANIIACTITL